MHTYQDIPILHTSTCIRPWLLPFKSCKDVYLLWLAKTWNLTMKPETKGKTLYLQLSRVITKYSSFDNEINAGNFKSHEY